MLYRVLQEIESSRGPVSLNDLSRRLGLERSALQGMIAYWVRKGRLIDDYAAALESGCGRQDCAASCPAAHSCPQIEKLPRSLSPISHHNPEER